MIICLRTVSVPAAWRERYLAWIEAGRVIREQHGILAELVCQPSHDTAGRHDTAGHGGGDDLVVITAWPSHDVFEAWIATPHRDALTASEVHRAVRYRPITRYNLAAGYLNLTGLTRHAPNPSTESPEELP